MARWLLVVLLVAGCAESRVDVTGTIDGEPVPLVDAAFIDEWGAYDDGDGMFRVVVSSIPDPCAFLAELREAREAAETPEEYEAADALWPDEYWMGDLWLRVADPREDQAGLEATGIDWEQVGMTDAGEFRAVLDHAWPGDAGTEGVVYVSHLGSLRIDRHRPERVLAGTLETDMVEFTDLQGTPGSGSGEVEGSITLDFRARYCLSL